MPIKKLSMYIRKFATELENSNGKDQETGHD